MKKNLLISFLLSCTMLLANQRESRSYFIDHELEVLNLKSSNKLNAESYHLFTHGKPGYLFIDDQWLGKEEIAAFLSKKLNNQKELLIYGCEFAQGEIGREAVAYLEQKLNLKVSASVNITGKDGDWILEYGQSKHTIVPQYSGNLQLDNTHYLNPLVFGAYSNNTITEEYIYLSTPSVTDITVNITDGAGNAVPRMSVTYINTAATSIVTTGSVTFNNSKPIRITMVNGSNVALAPGTSPMTIPVAQAGVIVSGNNAGLIFTSTGEFFVNYRGRSNSQAGSVLTKGEAALGKEFRWGGTPIGNSVTVPEIGNMLSIMATENNTNVTISNIDAGTEFLNGTNPTRLTGTSISRTLQKGESFILYAPVTTGSTSVQDDGWLGAKVLSDKNIAVTVGGLMQHGGSGNQRDIGVDQLVPIENIGVEYVVMQGNGDVAEKVVLVATSNNTQVFLNGNATPNYTLTNAGDYVVIPSTSFNSDKNMFVKTNKPTYVFHKIFGGSADNTNNLMFIPPLSCFGQTEVNMVPDAHKIGTTAYANTELVVLAVSGTANAPVVVNNSTTLTPTSTGVVTGNPTWVSYRYDIAGTGGGSIKNLKISSLGAIQAEILGASSAAGFGGYYSGFGTSPILIIQKDTSYPNPCIGVTTLSVRSDLNTYQWYKDGVAIPGANSYSYTFPTTDLIAGEYSVIATMVGGCTVYSNTVTSELCPCSKPGAIGTPDSMTEVGISIRDNRSTNNWPKDVPNGFLAIEANNKGFVITRMDNPETAISTPVEGMLVFDTDDNCLKLYNGTWKCIEQTCN